tara:strand:+ start:36115 stop:36252 length:138 start_codon:yes stop_codon:yes gene_type:complete
MVYAVMACRLSCLRGDFMPTAKQGALILIKDLPDNASWEEIQYHL